ncbi:MAG: hypothetical protein JW969_04105 [Spirochaetales bacterium]|nr:hypothetical protein [Spirochaetales bacterium]
MIRIAKKTDRKKIEELKKKIHNEDYLNQAISMIAQNLTKRLLNEN